MRPAPGTERLSPQDLCPTADLLVDPSDPNAIATLQDAIDRAASVQDRCRITIELAPGVHPGPVIIPRSGPLLTIRGRPGTARPRLAAKIDAQMPGAEYHARFGANAPAVARIAQTEILGTQNSSVLRIERDGTWLQGLEITNTYECNRAAAAPPGAQMDACGRYSEGQHQAVALHIAGADQVEAQDLHLSSWQDTLYLQGPGRVHLTRCRIQGDVDFVFGDAAAFFDQCTFVTRTHRADRTWVLAPSTAIDAAEGFVCRGCTFSADGPPTGQHFLARQWFQGVRATPYGVPTVPGYRVDLGPVSAFDGTSGTISRVTLEAVGKVRLIGCHIGPHIDPNTPWSPWNGESGWNPRYRPVQRGPSDFLREIGPWLRKQGLDYERLDSTEQWLSITTEGRSDASFRSGFD